MAISLNYKEMNTDIATAALELTKDKDPFENELRSLKNKLATNETSLYKSKRELEGLIVRTCPLAPESKVGISAGISFGISGIAVVVLFVLHIIIWILRLLFDISWDTWGWTTTVFWWGLSLSSAVTLTAFIIYEVQLKRYREELRLFNDYVENSTRLEDDISAYSNAIDDIKASILELWRVRYAIIGHLVRTNLGIPFSEAKLQKADYHKVKESYFCLIEDKEQIDREETTHKMERIRQWTDRKLKFFYDYSMNLEITDKAVYREFDEQKNESTIQMDATPLRREISDSKSQGLRKIGMLNSYKTTLQDKGIEKALEQFQEHSSRDTKKLLIFTDTREKARQSSDMASVVAHTRNLYQKFERTVGEVTYALNFARACAYRNLYLGVELINYIRMNAGGSTLTTAQDRVEIAGIIKQTERRSQYSLVANTSQVAVNEITEGVGDLLDTFSEVADSRTAMRFVEKNPEIALAAGAIAVGGKIIGAAFNIVSNHLEAVEKNAEYQKDLTEEMTSLTNSYTEGKGQILRALEITKSIVKANSGFMAIYEPLREKVFSSSNAGTVSKEELIQLAAAMKEYKKISDAKIN